MWDRRNLPLIVAICLSVLLHVLTLGGAYESRIGPKPFGPLPGRSRGREEVTVRFALSDADSEAEPKKETEQPKKPEKPETPAKPDPSHKPDPARPAKPPQDLKAPRVTPKPVPVKPLPPPRPKVEKSADEMGEKTGTGTGANPAEGLEPLKALEADQDQGFLSRDPVGPGKVGNQPSNWLQSPGEGGRGGHPGSPAAGGAGQSADGLPTPPRETANARPAPRPEVARLPEPVLPPAAVEKPEQADPAAKPEKPDERRKNEPRHQTDPRRETDPRRQTTARRDPQEPREPAERRDSDPRPPEARPPRFALALPRPAGPEPTAGVHLGPLVVEPRPAAAPPVAGDPATAGDGDKGLKIDDLPPPAAPGTDDPKALLPRTTTRPTRTPGHADGGEGTGGVAQVPVPRIAPGRNPDPADAPPKATRPAFALALTPLALTPPAPTPPVPALHPAEPAIRPPPEAEQPKPAAPPAARPAVTTPPPRPPAASPSPAGPANLSQATGDGRRPGAPRPAADPAQMSDSESDPFSKVGAAQFRDGKLDVRFGRKVKTTRPHVLIAGQIDSFALRNPSVTLKVNIDATGKVTGVKVHKSSGSTEIDTPCLEAMYDWWFEPLKDASGKTIPDTLLFTITFR